MNRIIEYWDEKSDTWYTRYRTDEVISKLVQSPTSAFHHTTWDLIHTAIPNLEGKKVCVPSSGDNHAAFAFAILGAKVTSCDISTRQLEIASEIAKRYGWEIEFICDNTMELSKIKDEEYDFVFTSNGVHVWLHDLAAMYRNVYRILKQAGTYIMYDIHPFGRPFAYYGNDLKIVKAYDDTKLEDDVPNFHWRIQDIMNVMIDSDLRIQHIEEMFAEYGNYWFEESNKRATMSKDELAKLYDWKTNPLAALPQWLSVFCVK